MKFGRKMLTISYEAFVQSRPFMARIKYRTRNSSKFQRICKVRGPSSLVVIPCKGKLAAMILSETAQFWNNSNTHFQFSSNMLAMKKQCTIINARNVQSAPSSFSVTLGLFDRKAHRERNSSRLYNRKLKLSFLLIHF